MAMSMIADRESEVDSMKRKRVHLDASPLPLRGKQWKSGSAKDLLVTEPSVAAYEAMEVDVGLLVLREESFKSLCNTFAISRIRLGAVRNVAIPDFFGGRTERPCRVLEQALLLFRAEHTEEIARLRVVIVVIFTEIEFLRVSVDSQWRLGVIRLLLPLAMTVRFIAGRATVVTIDAHRAVTMVSMERALGRVHRNQIVIDAEAVALRVAVREQTSLKHPIRRVADSRDDVRRSKGSLLDIREEVLGIPVQLQDADFDQRIVCVRPDLCEIERVDVVGVRILLVHDLHIQLPAGEVAPLDGLVQVALVGLTILTHKGFRFLIREVLDALLGLEGELHPETLVLRVDEAVRVAAKAVHMAERARDSTIAHDNGDLVQSLGEIRPEVPVAICAAHAGSRIALDGVIEIGELERITNEEDGCVVSNEVPVTFLGIELQREAADVALGVGRTTLTGNSREASKHRSHLANLGEDLRLGVPGDIVRHGEGSESACSLGMHTPLWNHLAVEVRHLLDKPYVLE